MIIIFNVRKLHQHLLEDEDGVFAVVLTTLTAKVLREYLDEYELKHQGELFRPKKFQMLVQGDGQFLRFITVTTAY